MFKLDAIRKIQKVVRQVAQDHSELTVYAETDQIAYVKALVPILNEKLTDYELDVFIDLSATELSDKGAMTYHAAYAYYEMLFKFRVDPTFFGMMGLGGGKEDDSAQGSSGIGP